jgi:hypothetical protein
MRKVKLMADYNCFPLWEASAGVVGNIDPSSLPISQELINKLTFWAELYDATLNLNDPLKSGFDNAHEEYAFIQLGRKLREQLKIELGLNFSVETSF